jgi:LuxR family maltose regulon positive regulatory protein
LRRPIAALVAGAGCGKTVAVHAFLRTQKRSVIWVPLTERDSIEERFWEHFCYAVAAFSGATAARLRGEGFPGTRQRFDRYLAIPIEESDPRGQLVFVFDDLHAVRSRAVLRFIERSAAAPFPGIHTILISRERQTLNLTALEARGLVSVLSEDDLRFTREETAAYAALAGIAPAEETISLLYNETEGWPFALNLACLCLKRASPGGAALPEALRSNLFPLIESEVIAPLPPPLRRLLVILSGIHPLSAQLVDAIAGPEQAALVQALRGQVPFVSYDPYGALYRMHPLLRECLAAMQEQAPSDERRAAYRTAARWCAERGMTMNAIAYDEKAGDYAALAAHVYTLQMALPDRTAAFILDILERLPREAYESDCVFYIMLTRVLFSLGRYDEAEAKLHAIISRYEGTPSSPFRDRLLFGMYFNLGFIAKIRCLSSGGCAFAPYFQKGIVYNRLWGHAITGSMSISSINAYACRAGGSDPSHIENYIAELREAIPAISEAMSGCMEGMEELCLGERAFFRMDMREAKQRLGEAFSRAREKGQFEIESQAAFYLFRLFVYEGEPGKAAAALARIEALCKVDHYPARWVHCDIFKGWASAHLGRPGSLAPWLLEDDDAEDEGRLNGIARGLELLTRAKALFRARDFSAALAELARCKASVGAFLFGRIESACLEALALRGLGDEAGAFAALAAAVDAAAPGGFFLPFAEAGKDMRALAAAALQKKAWQQAPLLERPLLERIRVQAAAYAKKLYLCARRLAPETVTGRDGLALSPREQATLRALFEGFTGEELAESEGRSFNTVKSEIRRIYEKLGAINRADAIRIALSRGLLK